MSRTKGSVERRFLDPAPSYASSRPIRDAEKSAAIAQTIVWAGSPISFAIAAVCGAPTALALAAAVPCAIVASMCPFWARRSAALFDRALVRMLANGNASAALTLAQRAYGMRFFGRREIWWERLGRAASAAGDMKLARRAFGRALGVYRDEDLAPLSVRLGYAHACYALGDDVEACWAYERIVAKDGIVPRVATNLAHALYRRSAANGRVEDAIACARHGIPSAEERAVLTAISALIAIRRGRRPVRSLSSVASSERVEALQQELWRKLGSKRSIRGEGVVLAFRAPTAQ